MDKIVFKDEFIPTKEDAVRSILDYAIDIFPLADEEKQVVEMIVSMKMPVAIYFFCFCKFLGLKF